MKTFAVRWKRSNRWDVYPQNEHTQTDHVEALDERHAIRILVELPHVRVSPPEIVAVCEVAA